jgi:hypothetical protein
LCRAVTSFSTWTGSPRSAARAGSWHGPGSTEASRPFPLGSEGRYHARDYLVREAWLIEFLESNAIRRGQAASTKATEEPVRNQGRRPRIPKTSPADDWIGPCPV